MIESLLTILQAQGLLLDEQQLDVRSGADPILRDEDIADALWLADKIGGPYELAPKLDEEGDDERTEKSLPTQAVDASPASAPSVGAFVSQEREQSEETPASTTEKGLPVQVKAAPALPNSRKLGRSLRPLMRKVPSLTRVVLDAQATVNRIAEHDIWLPVYRPAPERWFDLELVVEASEFSFVWQDTLNEFQQLLECQGAFRNVRTWSVTGEESGEPRLLAKAQVEDAVNSEADDTPKRQFTRSPRELVDVSGRRLVLFVSDCRSRLWQQGKIHDWLALWSGHGPTAIAQLLPERLWAQSELDVGFAVQVGALQPGVPNAQLQIRELPPRTRIDEADSLALPVVTLTEKALKQWALVVSAAGRQRTPARLFDLAWVRDQDRAQRVESAEAESAARRVERFAAVASPMAQRLVKMMAAVPVELSVVRLIQQELLPKVTAVQIAEVYASGLLEETSIEYSDSFSSVDRPVRYDFVKGVRGLLNQSTSIDDTLNVIGKLSEHIAARLNLGSINSFTALLSPKAEWSQEVKDAILPFAQITTGVLHQLGGDYAELAKLVEKDARQRDGWIEPTKKEVVGDSFPPLEPFEFIDAQLVETETEAAFPPTLRVLR
ncbi:MAG: SAV_2336 N-terminal domain-related protein [Cyanobacteria bacterium J06629_19]